MREVLGEIRSYLVPGGIAILNYPSDPRKSRLTVARLNSILQGLFVNVLRVPGYGTSSAPVFEAQIL